MARKIIGARARRSARLSAAILSLAIGLGVALPQPASAEPTGVRAFLNRVIVYATKPAASRDTEKSLLSPQLEAAIQKYDASDDIGLDYDPICNCQDGEGMTMRVLSIQGNDQAAVARMENGFTGTKEHVTFHLTHGARGWRIADIETKDEPSLLRDLGK